MERGSAGSGVLGGGVGNDMPGGDVWSGMLGGVGNGILGGVGGRGMFGGRVGSGILGGGAGGGRPMTGMLRRGTMFRCCVCWVSVCCLSASMLGVDCMGPPLGNVLVALEALRPGTKAGVEEMVRIGRDEDRKGVGSERIWIGVGRRSD